MTARDVVLGGTVLFIFAIGLLVLYYVTNTIADELTAIEAINQTAEAVTHFDNLKTVVDRLDYVVFGIMMAFVIGIIVTSFFIGSHPILIFFYVIIITGGIVVGSFFSSVWDTLQPTFVTLGVTIPTAFPVTNHIVANMPIYMAVLGLIGMLATFAKPSGRE